MAQPKHASRPFGGFFFEVSMLKRLSVALTALFVLSATAFGAGTVPGFSLVPQFDKLGKIAPGCKLYVVQAGTVNTPQNAYQDSGLTILQANPLRCDAAGRLPQWFVADGTIKLRLTTNSGIEIFTQDGLLVIGASSGGGGGSPVDPTTIIATGDMKARYGTGVLTGFVRANGRTIGSATSGATERANSDTQTLFEYLWGADVNLSVSGGRGASANADWVANKTMALPDWRGRALAGLDDMGNSAAGRLTATYFGTAATMLGAAGGNESKALITAYLPPYTPAGTLSVTSSRSDIVVGPSITDNFASIAGACCFTGQSKVAITSTGSLTGVPQGGTSTPFAIASPMMLTTIYLKL